jgi:bifunctional NMN adenylyltransferase/nudix hydrolase
MIQRKSSPGENLFALPGGFINQDEYLIDAALRELREETRLKVPAPVLKGSIIGQKVFDNPGRSLRGRTITHAYAFELPAGELSKVKGGDDAAHARWIPIDDILEMEDFLFEDHIDIIRWAVSECK